MSRHPLKISSPLHATTSKVLRIDVDILVVVTASLLIAPALSLMEQSTWAAGEPPPVITLLGDGEVSVHKIRQVPAPCPGLCEPISTDMGSEYKSQETNFISGRDPQTGKV